MPGDAPIDPTQSQLGLHVQVPISFPLKGVVDAWGRETQEPATTPDALNVVPFDLTLRGRGGVRAGTTNTAGGSTYGSGGGGAPGTSHTRVQYLLPAAFEVTSGTQVLAGGTYHFYTAAARYSGLVAFVGGKVYYGSNSTGSLTNITPTSGGAFSGSAAVMAAAVGGQCFFTVYNGGTSTGVYVFLATGTTYGRRTNAPLLLSPRVMCAWRDRLLVAGTADGNPQNVYASRVGDPTDWNFGAGDPASAWALNADAKGGQVGDPVTALVPMNDNQLLIGADHSLWLVDGDPAAGGSLGILNAGDGIFSPTAWTMSDTGEVYFVGATGLCRLQRGTMAVENLSASRLPSFFSGLTAAHYQVTLQWDTERHGCWIFLTSTTVGGASVHLWWDARAESLFPVQLPAGMGPTAAAQYDDPTLGRRLLFGGYASDTGGTAGAKLYAFDNTVLSDDGAGIGSYVYMGPYRPGGALQQYKLTGVDLIMGEPPSGVSPTNLAATLTIQSGNSAYEAFASARATATNSLSGSGRKGTFRSRMSATNYFIKVSSSTAGRTWSFEEGVGRFLPAGRARA